MADLSVTQVVEAASLPPELGAEFAEALANVAAQAADDRGGNLDRRLRTIAKCLPVIVYGLDTDGTFSWSYGGGLAALGLIDDELEGKSVAVFGENAVALFDKVVASQETVSLEATGMTDGREWSLLTVAAPLGAGAGLAAVAFDVTDRATAVMEHNDAIRALRASEERFRLMAESAPIGIFTSDADGSMQYANPLLEEITGRDQGELIGEGWGAVIHEDDLASVVAAQMRFREDGTAGHEQFRVRRPDGSVRWVRARSTLVTLAESVTGTVGTIADITEFVTAEERLREREERFRAILETAAEGIITTDERGTIIEFNAAAERILGYDSEEVMGATDFRDLLAPELRAGITQMLDDYLAGGQAKFIGEPAAEVDFVSKDGLRVPAELAVTEVMTSEGRLFIGVLHDISERKAFELELEHQATHDSLTGLPNRALLLAELEAALNRSARRRAGVAVLFVELARIHLVTESLGHRAGDQILIDAAARLEAIVAPQVGTVTRFGGDQFVVFIEDLDDVGDAVEVTASIIDVIDRPYSVGSEEAFIKAHVGIAFAQSGAGTAESLISNADVAMNRSKTAGGLAYEVFDTDMRAWVDSRRKLEVAMRHGIERGEFELYYQPVIEIATLQIHGFEALVRWNHPELGLVPPIDFIPLAEDTGLIIPLGEHILRNACDQLAAWQHSYPERALTVSVNLSGRQLALADLPATVAAALISSGANPNGLDLEITETVLLDDVDSATRTLDGLKKIGVNLSMDDFGTGYSSLTYLCQFPIDVVKIDRSFVSQIGTQSRDASIVSLVVGLAQTLHLDVVAEGVETIGQLEALEDLDCSYAQGYYFSKPRPVAEAEKLLADGIGTPVPGAFA